MGPVESRCVECGCVIHADGLYQHTMWHEQQREIIARVEQLEGRSGEHVPADPS